MLIIATGGTFDKDYNPQNGLLYFTRSCVPDLLTQARVNTGYRFVSLMQKDSLDMQAEDRSLIADTCLQADEQRILIIHGTDTMTDTGHYLQQQTVLNTKTIVLTGAMRPQAFGQSDAIFNLGYAFAMTQQQAAGIYIAIQGDLFHTTQVIKDRQAAQFVRTT